MLPTFEYDNAVKMADDDVIQGVAIPGDCRCRARAMGRVYRHRSPFEVGSAWPRTTPDGTTLRRPNRDFVVVAAPTTTTVSAEPVSTAALPGVRTLLIDSLDPSSGTSLHSLLDVRLADTIWQSSGNSILRRTVSSVLPCRRRPYARSRRRQSTSYGGAASSLASSLLAAALLVSFVSADPRRLHSESSHAARQLSSAESSKVRGAPRRPQTDDVGAGTPCIYEGHIKTDR